MGAVWYTYPQRVEPMLSLVFMGTSEFALPSLKKISEADFLDLKAVVTQPDRPKGRGYRLEPPPVKRLALELGLPVLQPERASSPRFVRQLRSIGPDLIVVVAYGQLLKRSVLEIPPRGCINLHPSLLPKYRGAAPIQRAIMNGERVTGVTVIFLDEGQDTGDIIAQREVEIDEEDTAVTLAARLAEAGADLLIEVLKRMDEGEVKSFPQDHSKATYAPKLTKEEGHIDWSRSSAEINRLVRAVHPWPGAYAFLPDGRRLKVMDCPLERPDQEIECPLEPGSIYISPDRKLFVRTGDGWIRLKVVQPEGKRAMSDLDFVNGYKVRTGDRLR